MLPTGRLRAVSASVDRYSWNVIFTVAVSPQGQRLPVEILRFQGRLSEVVVRIAEACQRWRPRKIVVENNAFQQAVLDLLHRDDPKLPLQGYRTGAEKADEQVGLPALAAAVDRGDWIIPAGGAPHGGGCACAYCAWQRELLLYPAGEHSDTIMGMWFAEIAAREAVRSLAYCWPKPQLLKTMRSPFAEFMGPRGSTLRSRVGETQ